jgi:hypothetical protein
VVGCLPSKCKVLSLKKKKEKSEGGREGRQEEGKEGGKEEGK